MSYTLQDALDAKANTSSLAAVATSGSYTDLSDKPTIPSLDGYATEDYVDTANATTRAIVQTWEGFLDGSNVVFSITNYISGSYNLDTAKLRILEMTNGVYREVYNSRGEIVMHLDAFKTNDFRVATNKVITAVNAAVANKADKAWGKYTSAGGDAPSNTVYMTAPNTVFAGGMEYERVAVGEGSVCVLTTKGAPVWTQGDEGTFKFQDDGGTNYFGFAKTDSYVIGANTDGITVNNNIVTLEYDVTMSGVPCIWYKGDLATSTPWEQLNTSDGNPIAGASHVVQWEATPPAGQELCYINCPEPKGFFKATIEVPGSAKFMTNMPADLGGGILCTNKEDAIVAVRSGSQITWKTTDGSATSEPLYDYALTNLTAASLALRSGEIGNYSAPTNFTLTLDFVANGRSGDCIAYLTNTNDYDCVITLTPNTYTFVSADIAKARTLTKATTNIVSFTRVKANTIFVSKMEVK